MVTRWWSNPSVVSALAYSAGAVGAAGLFFAATFLAGDYTWVARLGGSAWVLLLALIILMPTVTPWVKRRMHSGAARP